MLSPFTLISKASRQGGMPTSQVRVARCPMWRRLKVTYSASGRSLALRFPRSCLPSPSHGSEHWLGQLGVGTIGA